MSTKQTVIVSFMIVFLATMLFAPGAWYHYSTELDTKQKTFPALEDRRIALERILKGSDDCQKPAARLVDDPVEGLKKQLEDETARAANMLGDESKGVVQRQELYEQKAEGSGGQAARRRGEMEGAI